jgi:hypothetical protein
VTAASCLSQFSRGAISVGVEDGDKQGLVMGEKQAPVCTVMAYITIALLLGTIGCCPDLSAPCTPKVHLWFTSSAGRGDLPTAAKWFNLVWEFS